MTRAPDMDDFNAWIDTVYTKRFKIDAEDERDWNDMALGFLLARGVDHRVATDWELCSSFNCGDCKRAVKAMAAAERVWLAHAWADRTQYSAAYRAALVSAADANKPPAGAGVAEWVQGLDDAAWAAAQEKIGPGASKSRARAKAAREYLDALALEGRKARLVQIERERHARIIAGWRREGVQLPPCAASGCLCNPHDRGYATTKTCEELRVFDPEAPENRYRAGTEAK